MYENTTDRAADERQVEEELTVVPASSGIGPPGSPVRFFKRSSNGNLWVPRYYGVARYGSPDVDMLSDGEKMAEEVQFMGTLDATRRQPDAAMAAMAALDQGEGGVISLPCGYGKTALALYVACKHGRRTMVICHKMFLLGQWEERIAQFLPGARVGIVKQARCEVKGCDIILASMQSLAMHRYDKGAFDSIGFLIIDEAHRVCAEVMSRALFKMSPRSTLGLSATPDRKDGLSCVLRWFIGPQLFQCERDTGDKPTVEVHLADTGAGFEAYNKAQKLCIATMTSWLVEHEGRNRQLVNLIIAEALAGRQILILSERRAHLRVLHDLVKTHNPGLQLGYYVGAMAQADLDEAASKSQILFATYAMASEGLDIQTLQTIILASPKSTIEQSVGRVLRGAPEPKIIDISDSYSIFRGMGLKRSRFYMSQGWQPVTVDERKRIRRENAQTTPRTLGPRFILEYI